MSSGSERGVGAGLRGGSVRSLPAHTLHYFVFHGLRYLSFVDVRCIACNKNPNNNESHTSDMPCIRLAPPPPHDTGNMEPRTPCHRRSEVGILHPIEEVVGSDEEPEPESPIVRAPFSSSVGVCSGAVIGGGSGKCCLGLSCCGVCSPSHQWRFFLVRRSHPISVTRSQGIP